MRAAIHHVAARGFGAGADDYERARPDYPAEAVDCLGRALDIGPGSAVLDVGAGTGKLTRMLASRGAGLVAAEPVEEMRSVFRSVLPDIPVVAAVAEALPFRDRSFDAVAVGQAFHWFHGEPAVAEMARVLRPGGGLGLVWNHADERLDWVRRFRAILDPHMDSVPDDRTGAWRRPFGSAGPFGPLRERRFSHEQSLSPDDLLRRVASMSYVRTLEEHAYRGVLDRIAELVRTHPATAGRSEVTLPYVTDVVWTRVGPGAAAP